MKRYFFTPVTPGARDPATGQVLHYVDSEYQYLTLPNGAGHLVVMMSEHAEPEPQWVELPHLLEQSALPAALQAAIGSFAGIAPTDQTFHVARKLAALNRHFHP